MLQYHSFPLIICPCFYIFLNLKPTFFNTLLKNSLPPRKLMSASKVAERFFPPSTTTFCISLFSYFADSGFGFCASCSSTFYCNFSWVFQICQSLLPHNLRAELSLPTQTLGSWVWSPPKEWMFAFILFVLSCVGSNLVSDWPPIQGVLPTLWD